MEFLGLCLYAYLMGSIPTTYIVAKLQRGVDIRSYGSGNVGMSNLAHHVGKGWLALLLPFEMLVKGASPVLIGRYALGLGDVHLALAGLLTIIGNDWSVFLKFHGGRGMAVVGGTITALAPWLWVCFAILFLPGWFISRSSAVWMLIGLVSLPLWVLAFGGISLIQKLSLVEPAALAWYCVAVMAISVLKRLLSNWEPLTPGLPRKKVLFNRLFRDRDVDDRAEWVGRVPTGPEQPGSERV